MPRKKQSKQAMSYKELENLFNQTEETRCELYKENQTLKKELDSRQDRYNMVEVAKPYPRYVDVPNPAPNFIEYPGDIATYLEEFFNKGREISRSKNQDYGNGDVFGNFREFGTQGFLVRMSDKWARIKTFAACGKLLVKDESVQDTLIDLANYCALLSAWLHNQKLLSHPAQTNE